MSAAVRRSFRSRSARCGCTGSRPPAFPTNTASIRLLESTGFAREGLARQYLCINGIWQDHLLYGLVTTDVGR